MQPLGRVSLVLGGGGARGYAHIGAIEVLRERGIEIVGISGTSMGALVGGIYAAGKMDEFSEWARGLNQRDVLRLLDVSLTAPGVIRAERVLGRVRELIGDRLIEDLGIPFTAVATDLLARQEVWFQRGPLDVAIRASIALPGIFTPVMHNGRLLADGGLMDALPVAPTAAISSDATIAISLGGERRASQVGGAVRETAEPRPFEEWAARFRRTAAHRFDVEQMRSLVKRYVARPDHSEHAAEATELDIDVAEQFPAGLSRYDVMNYALDATQSLITRYRLAAFPPDVLVSVPRDAAGTLEFHRATPMIELGRTLMSRQLDELTANTATRASDQSAG